MWSIADSTSQEPRLWCSAEQQVGAETQPWALLTECLFWCRAGLPGGRAAFSGFAQSLVWAGCDQGWQWDLLPEGEGGNWEGVSCRPRPGFAPGVPDNSGSAVAAPPGQLSSSGTVLGTARNTCLGLSHPSSSGCTSYPRASKKLFSGTIDAPFSDPPGPELWMVLSPPPTSKS